jgi:hypothetical protein
MRVCAVLMRLFRPPEGYPEGRNRFSDTLLPEPCRLSFRDRPWQSQQVVNGATEYEQLVHFIYLAQLNLSRRAGLL